MCNCTKTLLFAFLGGAIVGATTAVLFAPKKGDDLRQQIKGLCQKYGLTKNKGEAEVDRLVGEIAASIQLTQED